MLTYLILLFTVIPALELYVLLTVGAYIGPGNTLLIIIVTGVLGAYMARLQGFFVLQNIQREMNRGAMPSSELLDGLMILVAGIVLLTPGFITDMMGFLLLIPWFRSLIKGLLKRKIEAMISRGEIAPSSPFGKNKGNYEDIDIG